jgi:hypothetical protein
MCMAQRKWELFADCDSLSAVILNLDDTSQDGEQ